MYKFKKFHEHLHFFQHRHLMRGVQKVRSLTHLTTRYTHHILPLFKTVSSNWHAHGPRFLQAGMACGWVGGKTVWSPRYTRPISECLTSGASHNKVLYKSPDYYSPKFFGNGIRTWPLFLV